MDEAGSREEAISLFREHRPDMTLMDRELSVGMRSSGARGAMAQKE